MCIAVHPLNKKVYITDRDNNRLQILNADLTFFSYFGSKGSDNGEFDRPQGVAFDSTGNVYVADCENHRIQVFTPEGEFFRKFGREGKEDGEMNSPSGICIDSDDVVYVTEFNNNRVSLFSSTGIFLTTVGSKDLFDCPRGIAVDKNGVLYVSDYDNLFRVDILSSSIANILLLVYSYTVLIYINFISCIMMLSNIASAMIQ